MMGLKLDDNDVSIKWARNRKTREIRVQINTPHLVLRSTNCRRDRNNLVCLFRDERVTKTFASGKPVDPAITEDNLVSKWAGEWKNGFPIGGFAVYRKENRKKKFAGLIYLMTSSTIGVVECGYIYNRDSWGKGVGSEAFLAISNHYFPKAAEYTLLFKTQNDEITKAKAEFLVATVKEDNVPSKRILKAGGLSQQVDEKGNPIKIDIPGWEPREFFSAPLMPKTACPFTYRSFGVPIGRFARMG